MRWSTVLNLIGLIILCLGGTMLFPLIVSLIYRDGSATSITISIILTLLSGAILYFSFSQKGKRQISQREGMAIVAFGWTAVGLFGSFPFLLDGVFTNFVDAFFESVSGFTTTGASVLTDIESVSKSILFWRSFIQWLGGMGIIVFSLAILPFLGVGGMQLFKAEVPSPVPDKLVPRLSDTAKILWKVYILFSIVQVVALMLGGMSLFDAICHASTTMPTGGFSTKNSSMAHFDSAYLDFIVVLFMLLAGINFSLHYQFLKGETLIFWRDNECRCFFVIVIIFTLIITFDIFGDVYKSIIEAFRYASFQVVSIVTTTGYATADYEKWPAMSQLIIFFCMFFGASAGSTGGGMKIIRIMISIKYCYRELFSMIHPHSVSQVKIGGSVISEDVMKSIMGFLGLYIILFVICSIILAGLGVDFLTAISAVASSLGNIGPGFGIVGPVENYAGIPTLGKWLLAWCMLLGRLEIYTFIILLVPEFWKK